jgi:hypothetical protein
MCDPLSVLVASQDKAGDKRAGKYHFDARRTLAERVRRTSSSGGAVVVARVILGARACADSKE